MFLSKLKIKNFRKYKELEVSFKQGLNVLIGENDGGKTTIIDAIRILLGTQSQEYYRIDEKDFNDKNLELEIENIEEMKQFFMRKLETSKKFGARLVNTLIENYFINEFSIFYNEKKDNKNRIIAFVNDEKVEFRC